MITNKRKSFFHLFYLLSSFSFLLFFTSPLLASSKGHVTIANNLEPIHLDPTATAAEATSAVVYGNIFQGLVAQNNSGKIVPCLAQQWKISEQGKRFHFHLNKGVTFHNGEPFTAQHVKTVFMGAQKPTSENARKDIFLNIKSIEILNDFELVIHLFKPDSEFIFFLSTSDALIPYPGHDNKFNPVGTGPYVFKKWQRGYQVILERNEKYWETLPPLKSASFRFVHDPLVQLNGLLSGQFDSIPMFAGYEHVEFLKKKDNLKVVIGSTEGETLLVINHDRPAFKNKDVRKALNHAIDKQAIVNGVLNGYGKIINSHFSTNHPAFLSLDKSYEYNPKHSRELLKNAGFEDNLSVSLVLPPPHYARKSGEMIAAYLSHIGMRVKVDHVDWATWFDKVFQKRNYDLTIIAHTEPLDIGIYGKDDYYFNYTNYQVKELLNEAKKTVAKFSRHTIYKKLQRQLNEDAVHVFLYELPKIGIWNKNLHGSWHNFPIHANVIKELSWLKEE